MIDKQILQKIIKDLIEVRNEIPLMIDDKTLFSEACSYHRGMLAGESKKNYKSINDEKKIIPMTDKQRDLINKNSVRMKQMGFDIENIQDKFQASKIIKQFIETTKKNEKNRV